MATTKVDVNLIDASSIGDAKYLKGDGTWETPTGGLFSGYAIIADQKADTTDGGTFTLGDWRTRDLNATIANTDTTNITLGTNQFTLLEGDYLIEWSAPALIVGLHQTRLYDSTGTAPIQDGSSEVSPYGTGTNRSTGFARVTVAASPGTNNYTIEHRCSVTNATDGFGKADSFGNLEVYTLVAIFKES